MSQVVNIKYKNNLRKIQIRQNIPCEDLQYLLASYFDLKGKIIGIKDKNGNLYDINNFLVKSMFKQSEIYEIIVDEQTSSIKNPLILENINISPKQNLSDTQSNSQNKDHSSISQFYSTKAALICDLSQFEKIFLQQNDSLISCLIIFEQFNLRDSQIKFQTIIENYKDEITFYYTISSLLNQSQIIQKSTAPIPCLFLYKGQQKILEISINQPTENIAKMFDKLTRQSQAASELQEQPTQSYSQQPQKQPLCYQQVQSLPQQRSDPNSRLADAPKFPFQSQQPQFVAENESFKGDSNDNEQQDIEQVTKQFISYLDNMLEQQDITNNDYYFLKCQVFEDIEEFIKKYFGEITEFDYILFREHIMKNCSQQNYSHANPVKETNQNLDDNLDRPLSRVQLKRTDRKLNQSLNGPQDKYVRLINNLKTNKSITEQVALKSINLVQADNQGIVGSLNRYLQGHILEHQLVRELEEYILNSNVEATKCIDHHLGNELIALVNLQLTERIQEDEQVRILNKLSQDKDELLLQIIDSMIKLMKAYAKRENNIENINSYQLYLDRQKHSQPFNQVTDDDELNQNQSDRARPASHQEQLQSVNPIDNNSVTKIDNIIIPSFKSDDQDNMYPDRLVNNFINGPNQALLQNQSYKLQQISEKMSERQSTKEKEKSNKSYQEISSKDNNERDFIDFIDKNINLLSAEQYGIVMHLYRIKDEDLFQLINQKKDRSPNITSIQVTATKKLNDLMQQEFNKEDINLINTYKNIYTTSTFAIYQRFRIECNFQQFIEELKQALENDKKYPPLNENQIDQESLESLSKDDQDVKQQTPSLQNLNMEYNNIKLMKLEQNDSVSKQQQRRPLDIGGKQTNSDKKSNKLNTDPAQDTYKNEPESVKEAEHLKVKSNENSPNTIKRKKDLTVQTYSKYKKGHLEEVKDIRIKSNSDQLVQRPFQSPSLQPQSLIQIKQASQLDKNQLNLLSLKQAPMGYIFKNKLTIQEDELHEIFKNDIQNFFNKDYPLKELKILQEILEKMDFKGDEAKNLHSLLDAHHGDIHEIIYQYQQQQSIEEIEDDIKQIAQIKIQDLGIKKVKKFNHFNAILRNMYENDMVITRRQYNIFIYQFLEEEICTLSAFEAYLITDDQREFVENLSLIEKINYFQYNINYKQIENLKDNNLEKMKFIFSFKEKFSNQEKMLIDKMIYENDQKLDNFFQENKYKQSDLIVQALQKFIQQEIAEQKKQLVRSLNLTGTVDEKIVSKLIDNRDSHMESILQLYSMNQNAEELSESLALLNNKICQETRREEILRLAREANFGEQDVSQLSSLCDSNDQILVSSYNFYLKNVENDPINAKDDLLDTIQKLVQPDK